MVAPWLTRAPCPGRTLGPVALLTAAGTGPAPLLAGFQMAALALAVKGIFQVQHPGLGPDLMAFCTGSHRLPLAPDIAAVDIIMVAGRAGNPGGFMALMAEQHRPFLPALEALAFQPAHRLRGRGPQTLGAQHRDQKNRQQEITTGPPYRADRPEAQIVKQRSALHSIACRTFHRLAPGALSAALSGAGSIFPLCPEPRSPVLLSKSARRDRKSHSTAGLQPGQGNNR